MVLSIGTLVSVYVYSFSFVGPEDKVHHTFSVCVRELNAVGEGDSYRLAPVHQTYLYNAVSLSNDARAILQVKPADFPTFLQDRQRQPIVTHVDPPQPVVKKEKKPVLREKKPVVHEEKKLVLRKKPVVNEEKTLALREKKKPKMAISKREPRPRIQELKEQPPARQKRSKPAPQEPTREPSPPRQLKRKIDEPAGLEVPFPLQDEVDVFGTMVGLMDKVFNAQAARSRVPSNKYCSNCGKAIMMSTARYCAGCGKAI